MGTKTVKGRPAVSMGNAAGTTANVILEERIPVDVAEVTVTYEVPMVEPKAGQLWEDGNEVQFCLIEDKDGDFQAFIPKSYRRYYFQENPDQRDLWVWMNARETKNWLQENCKLIKDAPNAS